MGEGSFFTASCQLSGIGTMYVTSFDNSEYFLGVEVANFVFRCRVAFLFHVAEAYMMGGAIFGGFTPLVLMQCSVVALAVSAPLVLMQESSFLVDCHRVRTFVTYLVAVLHLHHRGPPQRLI